MTFPIALDNLSHTVNNSTPANKALFDAIIDATNNMQAYVGISSAVQSAAGTLTERINFLLNAPGGIIKQATAPVSPATNDLWIDTSTADRPLEIFYSSAWHYISANALTLQGRTVHTAAPADGNVLTWDTANTRWAPAVPAGGMANPFIADGDTMYAAPTTHAPARLPIGTPGQIYAVSSGTPPLPVWITAPYIPIPSSANIGAVLVKNVAGTWVGVDPGTTGYALTSNGAGAVPSYQAIPVTPPGANITAPAGARVGSLIQFDGSVYIAITPGSAGQYLTAHGDSNTNPAALLTWTTSTALANPMTAIGSLIKGDTGGATIELVRPASSGDWPDSVLGVTGGTPTWVKQSAMPVQTYKDWVYQSSAPGAPAALTGRIYWKTDGKFYGKNAAGTEYDLTAQPAAGSKHIIQDEGTPLTARTNLNFVGTGVTATDDAGNDATVVTIPSYYNRLQVAAGTPATQRGHVNYIGSMPVTLADNAGNDSTDVTIGPDYATANWIGGD